MKYLFPVLYSFLLLPHLRAQNEIVSTADSVTKPSFTKTQNQLLETAYLLTAISRYEDAHAYFAYILRDTQLVQLYNNAGIVSILDALSYFRPTEPEVKFRLPVELDLELVGTRDLKSFEDIRNEKLQTAISHFDSAILLNAGYAPAYLNKACVYALLNEFDQARSLLDSITKFPDYEKTGIGALVLQGILFARQNDSTQAVEIFKNAAAKGSMLAEHNLNILQGTVPPAKKPVSGFGLAATEKIDGNALDDPYNIPEFNPASQLDLSNQISFYNNLHPGPNSYFYLNYNAATGRQTYFLLTGPDYPGTTTEKLSLGADSAAIAAAYPTPLRTVETLTGELRIYKSIILFLGHDHQLERWALYGELNE